MLGYRRAFVAWFGQGILFIQSWPYLRLPDPPALWEQYPRTPLLIYDFLYLYVTLAPFWGDSHNYWADHRHLGPQCHRRSLNSP